MKKLGLGISWLDGAFDIIYIGSEVKANLPLIKRKVCLKLKHGKKNIKTLNF